MRWWDWVTNQRFYYLTNKQMATTITIEFDLANDKQNNKQSLINGQDGDEWWWWTSRIFLHSLSVHLWMKTIAVFLSMLCSLLCATISTPWGLHAPRAVQCGNSRTQWALFTSQYRQHRHSSLFLLVLSVELIKFLVLFDFSFTLLAFISFSRCFCAIKFTHFIPSLFHHL